MRPLALVLLAACSQVGVEGDRRVLRSSSGYQTVSMLDGGQTGLYFDFGEEAGRLRPDAHRVALLGMGGGEMLRAARRTLPSAELVGVDLDEKVAALAISDFGVLDFGAQVVVADALEWLQRQPARSIDILMVDVFDDDRLPVRFRDVAFYDWAERRLAPGGLLVQNVWPASLGADVEMRMRRAGFKHVSRRGLMAGNVLVFAE